MSLEGLDSAALVEACDKTQTEEGGWFWAKYESRDEIAFLSSGSNGIDEMRSAAMNEPDDSPLYGLLRFKARSVLVKYLPSGTSRVLKARSQVHFQLVVERFAHESTVSIEAPQELNEGTLSGTRSLHAPSMSISSSSSSLRQRRLEDIAETAEEPVAEIDDKDQLEPSADPISPEDAPRLSTSSARPSLASSDIYNYYPYVPKVKLGPRPVETSKKPGIERAKTIPTVEELRASLPRSVHLPPRKTSGSSLGRSKSQQPASTLDLPKPPEDIPLPVSPAASVVSLPHFPTDADLTPEKKRLMKALELRRKQAVKNLRDPDEKEQTPTTIEIHTTDVDQMLSEARVPMRFEDVDDASSESTLVGGRADDIEVPVKEPAPSLSSSESRDTEDHDSMDDLDDEHLDEHSEASVELVKVVKLGQRSPTEKPKLEEIVRSVPPTPKEPPVEDSVDPTKVQDNVEDDSDVESIRSAEPTPVPAPIPSIRRASTVPVVTPVEPPTSPEQPAGPLQRPKLDRTVTSPMPPLETPVIETARSVSAPFLKTARQSTSGVPRKVNVGSPTSPTSPNAAPNALAGPRKLNVAGGGGSVSQRIKQFQMLAANDRAKEAAAALVPSRNSSVRSVRSVINNVGSPVAARQGHQRNSSQSLVQAGSPKSEQEEIRPMTSCSPSPELRGSEYGSISSRRGSRMEIVGNGDRAGIQVTSRITPVGPNPMELAAAIESFPKPASRDSSPAPAPAERVSSPEPSGRRGSVVSLRSTKREKSPKAPASNAPAGNGFLKRISSSLTSKPKEEVAAPAKVEEKAEKPIPAPEGKEVAKESFLMHGWINVQLPDTMLWRRRCMKISSTGWLFLSVTDDHTASQTRRYHLPTEVANVDTPDVDEQELPYSVRITLKEGGVLQCACQHAAEMGEVMRVAKAGVAV